MILSSASPGGVALTLAAAAAYAVPAVGAARLSETAARRALLAAWLLHAATLAWSLFGDTPRFGFAPAISVTAWLVLTVYVVEKQMFPQLRARWALAFLGAAAVLLAFAFPGSPLHVTVSPWLSLHWALGIAAYGLFAAAAVHAWMLSRVEHSIRQGAEPQAGVPLLTLERLTFRFATAGFVLLTGTLVAGIFFSEQLYGRAFRWDHKTIFSVLSWGVFAVLLLGRFRFGLRGRRAVNVIYIGSVLLLLAYVGSRFVLEVVLRRPA
ncbi:cytochrome c biogenesis protein CcsA [Ramlibacter sp. USB13]|uniref:Cytochrome c biogenesis protein CcsA n=1 Tax=Ramlibacter cellulosilyticus TaxID=2764187 RepID=A0A923SGR0_9BURK|nr:cytochrome c biogenesis protein CcsA [Ramlibacter cellulosilyticus]MBC5785157.1 cytochrome c biogenesis protein CcsA [Ramlibacter cellulosilyticus]